MRDLVVREGLEAMAFDAADRLRALIEAGEDIPYEVHEPGDGSPLCQYEPQTEIFIRDHAGQLRELDSFGACCAAIETRGLATGYLEDLGIGVPAEPRQRAELAGLVFLCRLWMGSSDFTLDDERLDLAIEEIEAGLDVDAGQIEVIVPLRGLQMPVARLDLAVASIVRADTVDVPPEARASDGLGISPWDTPFLAAIRISEHAPDDLGEVVEAGFSAVDSFRRLVTTLRLFKAGGVGLGPHAWTRMAGDRWRRIATGSGRHRPGGYRLTEDELVELAAFSRALSSTGTPFARLADDRPGFSITLGRALNRFEAGLERNVVIEALNDYLLALRFILEGGGPADLGLAMRVAALCAEPDHRAEVKAVVDRAAGLERELWSGEPAPGSQAVTPAETAATLEDLARAILKDAAAGHLGSDLRVTADEILLADGLAVGDGAAEQRGGTTEWDLEPVVIEDPDEPDIEGQLELDEELEMLLPERETTTRTGAGARGGLGARRANLTRGRSRTRGGACVRARARDLRRSRRGAAHHLARARPRAAPPRAGVRVGAGRGLERGGQAPRRRRRPTPSGEPGAETDRADARRARGSQRPPRRALPATRDHRVDRARDRLRPQPARACQSLRLPPTTPGRAGRATGPNARWLRPIRVRASDRGRDRGPLLAARREQVPVDLD